MAISPRFLMKFHLKSRQFLLSRLRLFIRYNSDLAQKVGENFPSCEYSCSRSTVLPSCIFSDCSALHSLHTPQRTTPPFKVLFGPGHPRSSGLSQIPSNCTTQVGGQPRLTRQNIHQSAPHYTVTLIPRGTVTVISARARERAIPPTPRRQRDEAG